MRLLWWDKKPNSESAPRVKQTSCSGCSTCYSKPIEEMPPNIRAKLEEIRENLIGTRDAFLAGEKDKAIEKGRLVKQLVREANSLTDLRTEINAMFVAHVPETEIRQSILKA